jgi:hypothetical protein
VITLGPGDSLQAICNSGSLFMTAMGELVPVGGGPPQPWTFNYLNVGTGWTAIYTAPAGYQALINHVFALNTTGATVKFALNVWMAAGGNTMVAGPTSISVPPSNGIAVFSRDGWHIYTAAGTPIEKVQTYARVAAPNDAAVAGGNTIVGWTSLTSGTYATAAANGITIQKTGNWLLDFSMRASNTVGNRYLGVAVGGTMLGGDYMVGGTNAASFAGSAGAMVWPINVGNLVTLNLFSDAVVSGTAWNATTHVSAFYLGPNQ